MQAIEPNTVANLKSGFRKCGIVPINVDELLQRLPRGCNQEAIENSFIANLDNRRQEVTKPLKTRQRMNIIAGKSISAEDVFGNEEVENNIETPRNSTNKDDILCDDSSGDDVETEMKEANDEADFVNVCNELASGMKSKEDLLQLQPIVHQVGRYVAFTYEGEIFAGQIVDFNDREVTISAMQKSLKCWKWPAKANIMSYLWEDMKGGLDAPKQISKRGLYAIPQLAAFWEK
ncbi:hypothetical protein NQ315_012039 [Exocentrus adspersus]|uniref:Uncharacterized protein n=1 Tax=Exocentrus adspersus TaxID=1586481 RepID=A0AAV8VJE2_9CUCU|nr:hypothetical protein NQ315_012039 [Exocentrus adspersus]